MRIPIGFLCAAVLTVFLTGCPTPVTEKKDSGLLAGSISLSNSVVKEKYPAGWEVGVLDSSQLVFTGSLQLTLPAGLGANDLFSIQGRKLTVKTPLSAVDGALRTITVRATDASGAHLDTEIGLSVQPVPGIFGTWRFSPPMKGTVAFTDTRAIIDSTGNVLEVVQWDAETKSVLLKYADAVYYKFAWNDADPRGLDYKSGATAEAAWETAVPINETIELVDANPFAPVYLVSDAVVQHGGVSGAATGGLSVVDIEGAGGVSYALASGGADNGSFAVAGGEFYFNGTANFPAKKDYTVRIRAVDPHGYALEGDVRIPVRNTVPAGTFDMAGRWTSDGPGGFIEWEFAKEGFTGSQAGSPTLRASILDLDLTAKTAVIYWHRHPGYPATYAGLSWAISGENINLKVGKDFDTYEGAAASDPAAGWSLALNPDSP